MRFLIYLLLFTLFWREALSQENKLNHSIEKLIYTVNNTLPAYPDSCLRLLHKAQNLTSKVTDERHKTRYLAESYRLEADILSRKALRTQSDSLARLALLNYRHLKDPKGISQCYTLLASNAYALRLYDTTSFYFDKALTYALQSDDHEYRSEALFNSTYLARQTGRFADAFKSAYEALKYAEKSKDSVSLAKAYYLLSLLNYDLQNYSKAQYYIEKAKLYGISDKLHYSKMEIWKASGEILLHKGEKHKSIADFEKTLQYSIEYNQKCGALQAYTNLGSAFTGLKNWEKAQEYFEKSKMVSDELGVQPAFYLINLARLYSLMDEHDKAFATLTKFLELKQDEIKISKNVDFYRDISFIYEKGGKSKEALHYYKLWSKTSDSIRSTDNKLLLAEIERKYTIEKKDAEIARQELALSKSELSLSRSRNNQMWLGALLVLVCGGAGILLLHFRNRAQQEKQAYEIRVKQNQLSNILAVQEEERRRIARELHDGIGQSLAALKIQMQSSAVMASPMHSVRKIDLLCEEVRSLSHQMMPLILEEKGLEEALGVLIEQSFDPDIVNTHYVANGFSDRLEEKQEVHLYRIAQELLYNISKHARASEVGVQLLQNDSRIIFVIEDNGIGFNVLEKKDGIGLVNVNSRLEVLEGKMEIDSAPGKGTYIRITVPLVQSGKKSA